MRTVQKVMDRVTRGSVDAEFETPYGVFQIDSAHGPERVLAYCFYNILEHYRNSPLGTRIIQKDWRGDTFADVGANLGMYSLLARSAGAETVMFEPEPAHAKFLERNYELLGTTNPVALSDTVGTLPLFYSPSNTGATSLIQSPGYLRSNDTVPVSTFSQQVFGDPARIGLVKIDVEGNEAHTVRGMRDFLEDGHRPEIWCEVRGGTASRSVNSYVDVVEFLTRFGYQHHAVAPQEANFQSQSVFDLLFLPE